MSTETFPSSRANLAPRLLTSTTRPRARGRHPDLRPIRECQQRLGGLGHEDVSAGGRLLIVHPVAQHRGGGRSPRNLEPASPPTTSAVAIVDADREPPSGSSCPTEARQAPHEFAFRPNALGRTAPTSADTKSATRSAVGSVGPSSAGSDAQCAPPLHRRKRSRDPASPATCSATFAAPRPTQRFAVLIDTASACRRPRRSSSPPCTGARTRAVPWSGGFRRCGSSDARRGEPRCRPTCFRFPEAYRSPTRAPCGPPIGVESPI